MREFGAILKKFRVMKNFGQSQLASEAGVVPSMLGDYERGAKSPKVDMRERLAHIMEVDPVELMGLDLSENDEIRILNKLLVKYCNSMGVITEGDAGSKKKRVVVTLPEEFIPLQETYEKHQEDLSEARSMLGDNASEDDMNNLYATKEAKDEMEFWLETWPEYDYMYQSKRNKVDPSSLEQASLKENLNNKFVNRFCDFQASYIVPKDNEKIKGTAKKNNE